MVVQLKRRKEIRYFDNLTEVSSVKKKYRKLCFEHHPDRGGDVEIMQEINVQYMSALSAANGQVSQDDRGQSHTYHYNEEKEQELIDKIGELLALHMQNIDIALIGVWIWITGETKQYKEQLKELRCKWHSKRKCWYFNNGKKSRYNRKGSLNDLANKYGYKSFENNSQNAIN